MPINPQLLNEVTDNRQVMTLVENDGWWMQEKHDGHRVIVEVASNGTVTAYTRKGLVRDLPEATVKSLSGYTNGTFDGELVGDTYTIFDLLKMRGEDIRNLPYSDRLRYLTTMVEPSGLGYTVVTTHKTHEDKASTLIGLLGASETHEGVVFKRHDAPYTEGRPAYGGTWLKFKFYATASFVVLGPSRDGKRSVEIGLFKGGKLEPVGKITIYPNQTVPEKGEVVEVRYLHIFRDGRVYQPVYLMKRPDLYPAECSFEKQTLKFKEA